MSLTEERIREIAEGDNACLVMTPEEKIELASALLAAQQELQKTKELNLHLGNLLLGLRRFAINDYNRGVRDLAEHQKLLDAWNEDGIANEFLSHISPFDFEKQETPNG